MAVGTPLYMSPEQAAAVDEIDGRSDIYSLGCVLYEMLTGTPPFTGPTPQAVMARHSLDHVPSPAIIRDTISPELEEILYCALAKSPADRFRTAADLAEALKVIQTGTGTMPRMSPSMVRPSRVTPTTPLPFAVRRAVKGRTVAMASVVVIVLGATIYQFGFRNRSRSLAGTGLDPRSVAVLYFEDLSPNGELRYLADGLTEGLIRALSQVRALDVVSRNGVAPYRSGDIPRDSIARVLEVGSLIDGSVEQVGDRVRVTTRLVDGNSGADFGRSTFELPASELLIVRDSVAEAVSSLFRKELGEEIRLRQQRVNTASVEAWSLVQRGERIRKDAEALIESDSVEAAFLFFDRAESILAAAEAADPKWVTPVALRGQIAYRRSRLAENDQQAVQWIDTGLGHAARALDLDPNYPEALELRGTLQYWHWLLGIIADPDESDDLLAMAKADLEAATKIDPALASAYSTLSHLYNQTDDVVSALLAARTAYEEDAYLSVANEVLWRLFLGHYDLEQLTQARRWCTEGSERFPDEFRFFECQLWIMANGIVQPNVEEAWRLWERVTELVPEPLRDFQTSRAQMVVGGILARAGLHDSARSVLVRARANTEIDPTLELTWIEAYMRVILGDSDEAIARLKLFLAANPGLEDDSGDPGDVYWWWRDLRDHPRFREIEAATR
jgi:serine/threonine-protein kinase